MDSESTTAVGIIGLGLMGSAMSARLIGAGYAVVGYDVSPPCRDRLREGGGEVAADAQDVFDRCDRVILSLPTSDDVEVVIGEEVSRLRPKTLVIDTTTGPPGAARDIGQRIEKRSACYLDATLSGSSQQVLDADIVAMVGGPEAAVQAARKLLRPFCREIFHVGAWGSGARMKLISNLALGLNRAALAESLAFARAIGFEPGAALEVLAAGAAYSRAMDTKGKKMVNGDFSPQARLAQHRKDVELILGEGAASGAKLPFSELHARLLDQLIASGMGDFRRQQRDFASV